MSQLTASLLVVFIWMFSHYSFSNWNVSVWFIYISIVSSCPPRSKKMISTSKTETTYTPVNKHTKAGRCMIWRCISRIFMRRCPAGHVSLPRPKPWHEGYFNKLLHILHGTTTWSEPTAKDWWCMVFLHIYIYIFFYIHIYRVFAVSAPVSDMKNPSHLNLKLPFRNSFKQWCCYKMFHTFSHRQILWMYFPVPASQRHHCLLSVRWLEQCAIIGVFRMLSKRIAKLYTPENCHRS